VTSFFCTMNLGDASAVVTMSSMNLSELATQKLQQVHHMVLQFQALENDLRGTFEKIERNHAAELQQLRNEIRQLKGSPVDASNSGSDGEDIAASNNNPLFNRSNTLQQNPLSHAPPQQNPGTQSMYNVHSNGPQQQQQQQQMGPIAFTNNNSTYSANGNGMNGMSTPTATRPTRNSVAQQMQRFEPPPPAIPKKPNHWNQAPPTYAPPQQNGYHQPNGNGKKQLPPRPNGNYPPTPQLQLAQQQQNPHNNMPMNEASKELRFQNNMSGMISDNGAGDNDHKLSTLDGVGSGISERDFYKKYWIEAGKIGEGAFARVRKITRKSDKAVFALKMIKKKGKSQEDIAALQREILVLQKCDHENIVRLGDWCDTKKRIYMVVEFCDGGDVFERVVQFKKFNEKAAIHVVKQVASGIAHVHELGFVHRDLKPDNLMYSTKAHDSKVKIIDFGLAGDAQHGPCKTPCGTAHYAAPEVLSSLEYDQSADMWSLGVIIYTLLCGFPPFFDASNNMKNLYHLIKKGQYSYPSPFWDDITDDAKDLINKLLVKDPSGRLTAEQVLEQPWITNFDNASEKDLGNTYVKQMSHWQSTRQATEFGLGQEAPPPPPPDHPIPLYYTEQGDK